MDIYINTIGWYNINIMILVILVIYRFFFFFVFVRRMLVSAKIEFFNPQNVKVRIFFITKFIS